MDFNLTEDQLMIQAAARDFAPAEIAPVAARFDLSGDVPADIVSQAGRTRVPGY